MASPARKPVVLHIGDPIKYNPETYAAFSSAFDVIRPSAAERQRPEFIRALRERRWGDFSAIFRPFWSTGGEMGKWDAELISLLPSSCRVFASAGAGFDWADTKLLGERGELLCWLLLADKTDRTSADLLEHIADVVRYQASSTVTAA